MQNNIYVFLYQIWQQDGTSETKNVKCTSSVASLNVIQRCVLIWTQDSTRSKNFLLLHIEIWRNVIYFLCSLFKWTCFGKKEGYFRNISTFKQEISENRLVVLMEWSTISMGVCIDLYIFQKGTFGGLNVGTWSHVKTYPTKIYDRSFKCMIMLDHIQLKLVNMLETKTMQLMRCTTYSID